MKKLFLFLLFSLCQFSLLSQEKAIQNLKKYEYYIESRSYEPKWTRKYILKDGLVKKFQDIYSKKDLRNEFEYYYDKRNNIIKEKLTRNVGSKEKFKIKINHSLNYKNNNLIEDRDNYGWITHYSDFNKSGKPKSVKTFGNDKKFHTIEQISYTKNGNISTSTKETFYYDTTKYNEIEILNYKYDEFNNIIEIRRNYKPEKEFPRIMIGGLDLHKLEIFKYEYNEDNLWVKKSMFLNIDGQEVVSWTREYK